MHVDFCGRDDRGPHLVTRGNVDGILSAAVVLAAHPQAKVSFVPSSTAAVEDIRRDIGSDLVIVDLGLTPGLLKAINLKERTRQGVTFLDHHQQSQSGVDALGPHVRATVEQGASATTVTLNHFYVPELSHLAAVADVVEYCSSIHLEGAKERWGEARLQEEARIVDFAWRFRVEDDRFRLASARALSRGLWPSEVREMRRRYLAVHSEGRWERATARVRERLRMRGTVAILDFGKRKPSLLGFGTRALSAVADESGAEVAVMVNRRTHLSSVSLRGLRSGVNLGLYAEEFTRDHGLVGGGHPSSAGARIHTRDVPQFLDGLVALTASTA